MDGSSLIESVEAAFAVADGPDYLMHSDVASIKGMSGQRYRRFINELIRQMRSKASDVHYFEIGTWAGSTACAAIAYNDLTATLVDNWSQFGCPSQIFFLNLSLFISPVTRVSVLNRDYRELNYHDIKPVDVYFFDGPHEYQDQYQGITLALPALKEAFVLIVDDWNWPGVRQGTLDALRDSGLQVRWGREIRTTDDDTHPAVGGRESEWHNGYFICVAEKGPVPEH